MARHLVIEINETVSKLKSLHSKEPHCKLKQRLHALYLYKSGQAVTLEQLCALLNKSPSQVKRWFKCYRESGLEGLLIPPVHPGRRSQLTDIHITPLKDALTHCEFSSYSDIQTWFVEHYGLSFPYSSVHRWVRYGLGAKLKVARSQSIKQDISERVAFKKNSRNALNRSMPSQVLRPHYIFGARMKIDLD